MLTKRWRQHVFQIHSTSWAVFTTVCGEVMPSSILGMGEGRTSCHQCRGGQPYVTASPELLHTQKLDDGETSRRHASPNPTHKCKKMLGGGLSQIHSRVHILHSLFAGGPPIPNSTGVQVATSSHTCRGCYPSATAVVTAFPE
jgi:hypothetical protein